MNINIGLVLLKALKEAEVTENLLIQTEIATIQCVQLTQMIAEQVEISTQTKGLL